MSWEKLCDVKEGGGWVVRFLENFNIAMLEKHGWRSINNLYLLVTKLISARYF